MGQVFKRKVKSSNGHITQYWYIRYRLRGKDKWESVGRVGQITKHVAQTILSERERQIRLGQLDMIETEIPTLNEFSKEYIEYVRDIKKKRSWTRDQELLDNLCKYLGNKKLSEIQAIDLEDYKAIRLKEVKPSTINRALSCLRHLFNLAIKWKKHFSLNPLSQIDFFEEDNRIERILTVDEEEKLLANSPTYIKSVILFALNTAMRRGEILTLTWNNIDLQNRLITIEATNSKSKKKKRIFINTVVHKILLEQKMKNNGHVYVFSGSDGNQIKTLRTAFENSCKRAGIIGLRFHDLRHTAATRMIESGANIVAVSKILGHSTLNMTMRYAHPDDSIREALENLTNLSSSSCSNDEAKFTV